MLTFALNSLFIQQHLKDFFPFAGGNWNVRIVGKHNGIVARFVDLLDVIDIDQIGLMRTEKRFISKQLFDVSNTMRNHYWCVVGKEKRGGAIAALAVKDIVLSHQMNGAQRVECNALRIGHFLFFYKGNCCWPNKWGKLEFVCFGFEYDAEKGEITTGPAIPPDFSFAALKRVFPFCFS